MHSLDFGLLGVLTPWDGTEESSPMGQSGDCTKTKSMDIFKEIIEYSLCIKFNSICRFSKVFCAYHQFPIYNNSATLYRIILKKTKEQLLMPVTLLLVWLLTSTKNTPA